MKKTLARLIPVIAIIFASGCAGNTGTAAATTKAAETAAAAAETTAAAAETTTAAAETTTTAAETTTEAVTTAETTEDTEAAADTDVNAPDEIRICALKGPTAMGMTKLMSDSDASDDDNYSFSIYAAVDEISPLLIQGNTDIACVPANLASVLYNKTGGEVDVLAINTLGVLYIVENGESISSLDDLKGKTIYASGKGATPEFALNYLLTQNGIDPENDVNIDWKTEHSECLTALVSDENGIAMLPQPFVTTAMTKNEGIRVAIDLTEEWDKLDNGSSLLTGVVVGRKEFIDAYPDAVNKFLSEYSDSVDYVNANIDEAAELIGGYDIIPAAVAKKAIPECNIVCITGNEMKETLSGYLGVLYDQLPTSVGGSLPGDDFYYIG